MADNDPSAWAKTPKFNTWGHVGVPKDNAVYTFLGDLKESSDAIFEVVSLVFDLVNTALDFISSLLVDFTNPLKPIIEALISLLNSFVDDLRNLGVYLTYDKKELEGSPSEDILGGYPAFEQRLVKKLSKQKDPTRPDFSENTKVFAMTFFAGADATSLGRAIALIKNLLKLFLKDSAVAQQDQRVVNLKAVYYNNIVGEVKLPGQYKPDGIRLKWNLPRPKSSNAIFPPSHVAPDFFMIIATPKNFKGTLGYVKANRRAPSDPKASTQSEYASFIPFNSPLADPHFWPILSEDLLTTLSSDQTYQPIKIEVPQDLGPNGSWAILGDDGEIYLNKIEEIEFNSFFKGFGKVPSSFGEVIGDNDFTFDIKIDDLKINEELKDEYTFSVYSVNSSTQQNFLRAKDTGKGEIDLTIDGEISSRSAVTIKTPTDLKSKYLAALRFFYSGFLLARLDNSIQLELAGFSWVSLPRELSNNPVYVQAIRATSDKDFARASLTWIDQQIGRATENLPSQNTLKNFTSYLNQISNFPYDLYEELKKLTLPSTTNDGIYRTVENDGLDIGFKATATYNTEIAPFQSNPSATFVTPTGETSAYSFRSYISEYLPNNNPIFVDTNNQRITLASSSPTFFFGNVIYLKDFIRNMTLAHTLVGLSLAKKKETGAWETLRPFRDSDLSSISNVIEIVKKYMEGLLKGIEGIVAQVQKYINLIKTRIAELQKVIAKIKALIDIILSFRLPAGLYGTFHLTNGTTGLINALINSEDKPDIGATGYGTGAMFVTGGAPSIVIDLLIALMGGEIAEE